MELRLSHTLHLFNIFREYDGEYNCAQVLEEELHRILGMKYMDDEQIYYDESICLLSMMIIVMIRML